MTESMSSESQIYINVQISDCSLRFMFLLLNDDIMYTVVDWYASTSEKLAIFSFWTKLGVVKFSKTGNQVTI
jgi:hypothetical protein